VRIARDELRRIRELTRAVNALEAELAGLVSNLAPDLLAERGCGALTAGKLIGEIAGAHRFATDSKLAGNSGAAPVPASSGSTKHRLAISKARLDPDARAYLARKQAEGKTRREANRCLKRHLARRVLRILKSAPPSPSPTPPTPIGGRPRVIARPGRTIHCNTPQQPQP
jgi:transposase